MRALLLAALTLASPALSKTYEMQATPETVAWGHYDASDKPVLTIKTGDTVVMHTVLTNSPAGLSKAGVEIYFGWNIPRAIADRKSPKVLATNDQLNG